MNKDTGKCEISRYLETKKNDGVPFEWITNLFVTYMASKGEWNRTHEL